MKKGIISTAVKSLSSTMIEELAVKSGFKKREAKKITPEALLDVYCRESIGSSLSFNDIAGILCDKTEKAPSKQAVAKRVNKPFRVFLEMILEKVLGDKSKSDVCSQCNSSFQRILVQDSTVVKLPYQLFEEFSGGSNGTTKACNARIQAVYDLIAQEFLFFSIDKYSKNDLDAASELSVQTGDLILRDRGYLKYDEVKRLNDSGVSFIYRHMASTNYRDSETDELIDLPKLLAKNGNIDMDVCLNNDKRTPVRLVAAPVDEEIANIRRMKEKKKKKGHNPSKKLLFMMSWTIFITNLPRDRFEFKTILDLYGLRWRIETIFKTWKSNMSFAVIHRVSSQQLRAMLFARFIAIAITMNCVYKKGVKLVAVHTGKILSLTKLMRYIQIRKERLGELIIDLVKNPKETSILLSKFCTYDRRQRLNYTQNEAMTMRMLVLS
ncbi:MAG: IS4 family transposase [candidate division Zixibacteria bacterium]|nr:IS4 family transposase [candidate division Zixibacteria bacterium]